MIWIDLICENCGEANPPGTEFCRNCNTFLGWDAPATRPSTSVEATPTVPTSPAVEQPTVVQATSIAEQAPSKAAPVEAAWVEQTTVDQVVDSGSGQPARAEIACPNCGTVNPPARRFCAHCGYSFVAEYGTDPGVDWSGWTPQAIAAHDREAKRAYRRSLPPLYRWRRVIIAVIAFALFVGLGALLRSNPVSLAKNAWYRLTDTYVTVAGVQVQTNPTTATAPGSNPQSLVDGSVQEWTMSWAPTGESSCGAAPGTATVIFTFPATRVRQVLIVPGLDKSNPQRELQPQPKVIGLSFGDGPCTPVTLANDSKQQPIGLDSKVPVTQLRLGIASTYPAGPDAKPLISLTEVVIRAFPN